MKSINFQSVIDARNIVKHQMAGYNEMMAQKEMYESKLIFAEGNLLDMADHGEFDVIVQGCNCFNTMGGGIALQIAKRYPEAVHADNMTSYGDYNKLGNYTKTEFIQNFRIINAYTQYKMSTGTDVFEYAAFESILKKLSHEFGTATRYGFPMIGMGLARGYKSRIMSMLGAFAEDVSPSGSTVTVVEFKG